MKNVAGYDISRSSPAARYARADRRGVAQRSCAAIDDLTLRLEPGRDPRAGCDESLGRRAAADFRHAVHAGLWMCGSPDPKLRCGRASKIGGSPVATGGARSASKRTRSSPATRALAPLLPSSPSSLELRTSLNGRSARWMRAAEPGPMRELASARATCTLFARPTNRPALLPASSRC